jgi:CelD/BcsL family acetyltransferase involved in cellulose biosynthesis
VTTAQAGYAAGVVRVADLDAPTLAAWRELEGRALESNGYLSPHFVLPALRHLVSSSASDAPFLVLVRGLDKDPRTLLGVGVFEQRRPSLRLPLRHLKAFRSLHSYRSGLMIDRDHASEAVQAFFRFFCDARAPWHAVTFDQVRRDGTQAALTREHAQRFGARWHQWSETQRAVLVPRDGGEQYIKRVLSPHRTKKLRQARRYLEAHGQVGWRTRVGDEIDSAAIERFLELEHLGWKGEHGTSLRSQPAHELFFREMADGFRPDGRLFLTELTIGSEVIASSCNIISGATGFAFKIGWDPRYARGSPGVLNELEFVRAAPGLFMSLDGIDSGAAEGSFIEGLWADRLWLCSGAFATTRVGWAALAMLGRGRAIKRRVQGLVASTRREAAEV